MVAQLSLPWLRASDIDGGNDDDWWAISRGFDRAEYLSKLAGLHRPPRPHAAAAAEDERTPPRLRWPLRVVNAMPGIEALATVEDGDEADVWTLWWSILSADDNLNIGDVGPSRDGWLVSEWLVWLVRDDRRAGKEIESRVTAPPPMLNEPGAMMTFTIEADLDGPHAVDPHEFARDIVKLWSGDGDQVRPSGYFDVEWPTEVGP